MQDIVSHQNFTTDDRRIEALREMTERIVIVSLEAENLSQGIEQWHFRVSVMGADQQDDTVRETQTVGQWHQGITYSSRNHRDHANEGWQGFQNSSRAVFRGHARPDENHPEQCEPGFVHQERKR